MKTHHRLDVELTLLGPILTRGGQAGEPGIDAPVARDAHGRVMLPFSLVKGKIRDALIDLDGDKDPLIVKWLGKHPHWHGKKPGDESPPDVEDLETERGLLRFGDFHTRQTGRSKEGIIERIEIDERSGSAKGRMLAMLEAPFGYGEEVTFAGSVEFIADEVDEQKIVERLEKAFRWVPSFGAMRSVGFGRTHKVTMKRGSPNASSIGSPVPADVIPVRLKLDRPLCIVGRKHSRNHFQSLQNISGAILKGALARLILEVAGAPGPVIDGSIGTFQELCRNFETLCFAEARPMRVSDHMRRSVEPPLSIVTVPNSGPTYFDVAFESGPRLIKGFAPAFKVDWKGNGQSEEQIGKDFGSVKLPTERRTRTAIDSDTGRAKDEMLFSYGLVQPERTLEDGSIESFVWETVIDLSRIIPDTERSAVRDQLAELLRHGLPNIGKTRATAAIEWLNDRTPAAVDETPPKDGLHVVTLQTEFLMTDPDKLKDGGPEALWGCYSDFWSKASDEAFELVRYFARQSLSGGFQALKARPGTYEPFLLTDRGSVFVLRTLDETKAAACLERWSRSGLQAPAWVERRYGQSGRSLWMSCPFLPHVGYGEVAIDLACHTRNIPPEND